MRRVLITGLLVVAAAAFVACGSDDDGASAPSSSSDAGMNDMNGMMHDDAGEMGHMDGEENSPVVAGARRVEVIGRSFAFEPFEIHAGVGEDLAIVLTSEDILHDFVIDELDAHVAAGAGQTETGGVRADEAGRYEFYCSVAGHRAAGMEGTLVVEEE